MKKEKIFSYEKFRSSFSLNCPDDFNFAFDIISNKYGKSEDYENGKLDTLMQNGGGESHEERDLHCDEVENFTIKLLNASAQAPNINQAESIPFICRMAFNFQTGRWMEPSNGVYWYPYEVQGEFVNKARSQGLSEQDCIRTLEIENLINQSCLK